MSPEPAAATGSSQEASPISRVAVFLHAENPAAQLEWRDWRPRLAALRMFESAPWRCERSGPRPGAGEGRRRRRQPGHDRAVTSSVGPFIVEFAAKHRLRRSASSGVHGRARLIFYGPNMVVRSTRRTSRSTASSRAKPADLPVEQPHEVRAGRQSQDRAAAEARHSAGASAARGLRVIE